MSQLVPCRSVVDIDQGIWLAEGVTPYRDALNLVVPVGSGKSVGSVFFVPGGLNIDSIYASQNAADATKARRSPTYKLPNTFQGPRSIRLFASRIADAVMEGRGMKESADVESNRESGGAGSGGNDDLGGDDARRRRPVRRDREAAPASA